jgi:hypothetical protein
MENGQEAYSFALYSSSYWLLLDKTHKLLRIVEFISDIIGWPLFITIVGVMLSTSFSGNLPSSPKRSVRIYFMHATLLSAASGALILLFTPVYLTRHLLPIWPALSICIAFLLLHFLTFSRPPVKISLYILLIASLCYSLWIMTRQHETPIPWKVKHLFNEFKGGEELITVCNSGNSRYWNKYKLLMLNELGDNPRKLRLSDLTHEDPSGVSKKMEDCDAILVLGTIASDMPTRDSYLNRNVSDFDKILHEQSNRSSAALHDIVNDPQSPFLMREFAWGHYYRNLSLYTKKSQ